MLDGERFGLDVEAARLTPENQEAVKEHPRRDFPGVTAGRILDLSGIREGLHLSLLPVQQLCVLHVFFVISLRIWSLKTVREADVQRRRAARAQRGTGIK